MRQHAGLAVVTVASMVVVGTTAVMASSAQSQSRTTAVPGGSTSIGSVGGLGVEPARARLAPQAITPNPPAREHDVGEAGTAEEGHACSLAGAPAFLRGALVDRRRLCTYHSCLER